MKFKPFKKRTGPKLKVLFIHKLDDLPHIIRRTLTERFPIFTEKERVDLEARKCSPNIKQSIYDIIYYDIGTMKRIEVPENLMDKHTTVRPIDYSNPRGAGRLSTRTISKITRLITLDEKRPKKDEEDEEDEF